ncbi:alpha/beta fold hydrolase [Streptomyces sp. NPDC004609]|uniref:alpha/beta fold hydrolase n=1 Tax=Streptomyces sp. NPDC004609 TaxID=3364704 RepID=UPI0036C82430
MLLPRSVPVRALTLALVAGALAPLGPAPAASATAVPAAGAVAHSSGLAAPARRLTWAGCGPDAPAALECATLKVPLDYRSPGGRTIDIAVSRMATSVPGKRRGVLLLNPGGPATPGIGLPADMAKEMPKAVLERYDLIGFDPRGAGRSTPGGCGLTLDEAFRDKSPYRPETFGEDVAWARRVAGKCRTSPTAYRLPHITTRNTARDMDAIRTALGEQKISYLGISYGSYLGAVYTQMFPRRADRFVLDSAVDPKLAWRGLMRESARQAERAFTAWTRWTAEHAAVYGLGDTPREVRRAFWELVEKAGREPVELDGVLYRGDDIRREIAGQAHDPRAASSLVRALRQASSKASVSRSGHTGPAAHPATGVPLRGSPFPATGLPDRGTGASWAGTPGWDAGAAVVWSLFCGDATTSWPRDPEQYRRDAIRDRARHPLYGDFAVGIEPCAFWDSGREPATVVDNRVGALILQHEWDPATTAASGWGLHRAMKGSRMVFVAGGRGHGVYSMDRDPCAIAQANAYLTTGRLPGKNVVCHAPDPEPFTEPLAPGP